MADDDPDSWLDEPVVSRVAAAAVPSYSQPAAGGPAATQNVPYAAPTVAHVPHVAPGSGLAGGPTVLLPSASWVPQPVAAAAAVPLPEPPALAVREVDDDEAFFTTLAQQPKQWTQKTAPPPLGQPAAPAAPSFFGGASAVPVGSQPGMQAHQDDGASFFDDLEVTAGADSPSPAAGLQPFGVSPNGHKQPPVLDFKTPRRAAAEDVAFFAALQKEVGGAADTPAPGAHSPAPGPHHGVWTPPGSAQQQAHGGGEEAAPVGAEGVTPPGNAEALEAPGPRDDAPRPDPLARTLSWSDVPSAVGSEGDGASAGLAPALPWQGVQADGGMPVYGGQTGEAADGDFFETLGAPARVHDETQQPDMGWHTTQEAPPAATEWTQAVSADAGVYDQAASVDYTQAAAEGYAVAAPQDVDTAPALPDGWVSGYSPEGYLYYFDTRTGLSQWEPPVAAAEPPPAWPEVQQATTSEAAWVTDAAQQQQQQQQWVPDGAETAQYAYDGGAQEQLQQSAVDGGGHQPHWQYEPQAAVVPSYDYGSSGVAAPYEAQATPVEQPVAASPWASGPSQAVPAAMQGMYLPPAAPASAYSPHGRGACPTLCMGVDGCLVTAFPGAGGTATVAMRPLVTILRADGADSPGATYLADIERFMAPASGLGGALAGMGISRGVSLMDLARTAHDMSGHDTVGESHRLLWGILKLMCIHRGALSDDNATSALLELLASPADASIGPSLLVNHTSAAAAAAAAQEAERLLLQGKRGEAVAAALAGGLYGPALLLSRGLGDRAAGDAAAACVRGTAVPGTPWYTSLCMQAGLPPDPAVVGSPDGHARYVRHWRANLSALLTSRAPGDGAAMVALGDEVWAATRDCGAAHCCYLLAGVPPQAFAPTARLCLLGGDHRGQPRTYAGQAAAVHATEVLEAALRAANPQASVPSLQPYRLHHGCALAEVGRVREGLSFVDATSRAVKGHGAAGSGELNVPVFSAVAAAVEDRLRGHLAAKAGAKPGAVAASKLLGGLSTLVEKGISSIFGDEPGAQQQQQQLGPGYDNSYLQGAVPQQLYPPAQHDMMGAVPAGLQPPPPAPMPAAAPPTHRRQGSGDSTNGGRAAQPAASASGGEDKAAPDTSGGGSGGGGLVRSLSSMFGSTFKRKNEAKLGESNKFYFDEQLKMWVEEGKPPPPPPEPLAPPPTSAALPASRLPGAPPPMVAAPMASTAGGAMRSRYVDTFNAAGAPPPTTSALADVLGLPPRPKPAAGLQRPAFFVPGPVAVAPEASDLSGYADPGPPQPPQPAAAAQPAWVEASAPPQVGYGDLVQPLQGDVPNGYGEPAQQVSASMPAQAAPVWAEVDL
jgi:hypothetical protein